MFVERYQPLMIPDGQPQAGGQSDPQPQAGNQGNLSGTETPPTPPAAAPTRTVEDLEKEIAALRKESAGHRTKLTAFEKAEEEKRQATLTEQQRLEQRAKDAETKATQQAQEIQALRVSQAVFSAAAKLSIIDPDAAVKLLDWQEIEYDEQGQPKNIEKLLAQLMKDKPYLVAAQGQPTPPVVQRGPAMNPQRTQTRPATNNQPFNYRERPRLNEIWKKN